MSEEKKLSSEEIRDIIARNESDLAQAKAKALALGTELGKKAAKQDVDGVLYSARRIGWEEDRIDKIETEYLPFWHERLAEALRQETGLGPISDELKKIFDRDMQWWARIKDEYTNNHKEFHARMMKGHMTQAEYAFARMTEEEAKKRFMKDLESRFDALKKKVEAKGIGAIVKCTVERNEKAGFDGLVTGTNGVVKIETIGAGGYNIQRYHFRTLIK